MNPDHLGSDIDDFLREEGLLEQADAVATKRVLAYQISRAMEEQGLTKAAMARRMGTSRSSLDRLLDPKVPSVTLLTIERAARCSGNGSGSRWWTRDQGLSMCLSSMDCHRRQPAGSAFEAGGPLLDSSSTKRPNR